MKAVLSRNKIFVNQSALNTLRLPDLLDVEITDVQDGDIIIYDSATERYKNLNLFQDNLEIDGGEF